MAESEFRSPAGKRLLQEEVRRRRERERYADRRAREVELIEKQRKARLRQEGPQLRKAPIPRLGLGITVDMLVSGGSYGRRGI